MEPEVLVFLIPIFGILLGMLAVLLKHREKMAGLDGKGGKQTIRLLTDTLEKEHERIQQLQQRVETLEMIVTDEKTALHQKRRIELPAADAPADQDVQVPRERTRG